MSDQSRWLRRYIRRHSADEIVEEIEQVISPSPEQRCTATKMLWLTKNHSTLLNRPDLVSRVPARSIERFALSNLNRHADVLPIICGGVLRCHSRCFINGVRLNDHECASQLGDIQQRAIT